MELVTALGLSENVEIVGYLPEERKHEILSQSWVNLITSSREGFGLTVLEAGSLLTPTVAFENTALTESVLHGETGVLVRDGDVKVAAQEIVELMRDPARLKSLAENARIHSRAYDWETTAVSLKSVMGAITGPATES